MKQEKSFPKFLLPMYLWAVLLVALPLGYFIFLSFLKQDMTYGFTLSFTLDNYKRIFSGDYQDMMLRSVAISGLATLLCFTVGYPFSYIMSRLSGRARSVVMLLIVIPFYTNSLLRTTGIITLLSSNGLINTLLTHWGWIKEPLSLLYTPGATVVGMVYSLLPFMILPCYSVCQKLDRQTVEAARDLGASRVRSFFTVTLPLTLPGILSGCVLTFVPTIGMFFISDLLGGARSSMLGNIINQQINGRNLPFAAALSVVMLAMALLFIGIYRAFSGKSELEGIA